VRLVDVESARSGQPLPGRWREDFLMLLACGALAAVGLAGLARTAGAADQVGSLFGVVSLRQTGDPIAGAAVTLNPSGRTVVTDETGHYRLEDVPPSRYTVTAHLEGVLTEERAQIELKPGESLELNFSLSLAVHHQEITVTASGRTETAFDSFQSVDSRDSFEIAETLTPSLGELLGNRPGNGVASRSFGPGSSRPIIRGFDGDRVLILNDGLRTGTLSSQSGDHAELVNPSEVERVEVVKGPATLLYGSSALGGVVNVISRHHAFHEHPHPGLRGFLSGSAGSANAFANAAAGFELGRGPWMLWGSGGGQRAGDYRTPAGPVDNSRLHTYTSSGGFGRYGGRNRLSLEIGFDQGLYGIPFATQLHQGHEHAGEPAIGEDETQLERVQIDARRKAYTLRWGRSHPHPWFNEFSFQASYTDWRHDEVEILAGGQKNIGTRFQNRQLVYRGTLEQASRGSWSGRVGFWGMIRDYTAEGEEALSPPVDHLSFAAFGLQELAWQRWRLQFGGRIEHNRYRPGNPSSGFALCTACPKRSFTGLSGAVGLRRQLRESIALILNYTHSSRAPALEELYSFGPHVGNLAFEIGSPDLRTEVGNGLEVSLRQQSDRARGELNLFYYRFHRFVFPFLTGEYRHGLHTVEFTQRDARFTGGEANLEILLRRNLWWLAGLDYVDAQELVTATPLPRIPPLRGRLGLDYHWGPLALKPELVLVNRQSQTYPTETPTAGYAVVHLRASYTLARGRAIHQVALNFFNIGNRLYRNHTSFIKDLAPEIGRGVRITYKIRFF